MVLAIVIVLIKIDVLNRISVKYFNVFYAREIHETLTRSIQLEIHFYILKYCVFPHHRVARVTECLSSLRCFLLSLEKTLPM